MKFDTIVALDIKAVRLLLATDPDPNMDPTMKQAQGLAILLKSALGDDKHHLRHDVLRIITGIPIISQWGLSSWYHHMLITFIKADKNDKKGRWQASIRGRRVILESARVAEALIGEYEDHVELGKAEAEVFDLWEASRQSAGHARSYSNTP